MRNHYWEEIDSGFSPPTYRLDLQGGVCCRSRDCFGTNRGSQHGRTGRHAPARAQSIDRRDPRSGSLWSGERTEKWDRASVDARRRWMNYGDRQARYGDSKQIKAGTQRLTEPTRDILTSCACDDRRISARDTGELRDGTQRPQPKPHTEKRR